jgi:tRNA(His) 5'-end guanylyltransferase
MSADQLGDRMKEYEHQEAGRRLMPLLPVMARLDGKCFSSFTKGLARPYDPRLSNLMASTVEHLLAETGALAGYTQSDEITLLLYSENRKSQIFLDRRVQKLTSILASMTTAYFNAQLPALIPERRGRTAVFDCRVWSVPNKDEAANVFLWREIDATKNSVSMAAREYYSHQELLNKGRADMQEMLFQKGVNWNDYPAFFKRGTYVLRKQVVRRFTALELEALPPRHAARLNPELEVCRQEINRVLLPPFARVANRVEVLFEGAKPETVGEP